MNTAVINIKTEPEVKIEAQKIARELGVSLSSLINSFLKHFVKTKKITFSAREEPSAYLKAVIKKARENRRQGKSSPVFDNVGDSFKWLQKQGI
ncbi:MAG: RelB [Candidatus Levybacteria bacterium]|nr:RelB [Candidatus Levybacteria bacterium]